MPISILNKPNIVSISIFGSSLNSSLNIYFLCAITFPFFWLHTSIDVIGIRIPYACPAAAAAFAATSKKRKYPYHNISPFGSAQDEHRALSNVFVARRIRDNGHPAKMLKPFVVRLYKKITLGGFAFLGMAARCFILWHFYKRSRISKPSNQPIKTK